MFFMLLQYIIIIIIMIVEKYPNIFTIIILINILQYVIYFSRTMIGILIIRYNRRKHSINE